MKERNFQANWEGAGTPFPHTWAGLVNIDQFQWMARGDVQQQLKQAHEELGARHVRAVGMFDDALAVMGIDPKNFALEENIHCRPNYQNLDYITDTLVDMGISPMITTTFIPGCMASGTHTVFETKSRTDLPRDLEEWEAFVRAYVLHITRRYGEETVKTWYFEVWNEPNLAPFFPGSQEDFFRLWEVTCRAVKSVSKAYRIGGPSTARGEWIRPFLEKTRELGCPPDFITAHIYNKDGEEESLSPFAGAQQEKINTSPHFAAELMKRTNREIRELGFLGEIHWNEWGRSWWVCDPERETANEAAYIVKTMGEVSDTADYYAYWCLSDIYNQGGFGAETFHGGYGLMNINGLRKPAYYGFSCLNRLGNVRIPGANREGDRNSGILCTREEEKYTVLFYHYCAGPEEDCRVLLPLPQDWNGQKIQAYRVDREENNVLARWRELGSPGYLSRTQLAELRSADRLTPAETGVQIENNVLTAVIKGGGIVLAEIPRKKKE